MTAQMSPALREFVDAAKRLRSIAESAGHVEPCDEFDYALEDLRNEEPGPAPQPQPSALHDAARWILDDAAFKAPEQIGDVPQRWLERLRDSFVADPSIATGELHAKVGGNVVGKIVGIGAGAALAKEQGGEAASSEKGDLDLTAAAHQSLAAASSDETAASTARTTQHASPPPSS